jgi:hypothetical protein
LKAGFGIVSAMRAPAQWTHRKESGDVNIVMLTDGKHPHAKRLDRAMDGHVTESGFAGRSFAAAQDDDSL